MKSCAVIILCGFLGTSFATPQTFPIAASQKKIQLDGFLLDWSKETVRTLGFGGTLRWDAVATSEGLAGYLQSSAAADTGAPPYVNIIPNPSLPSRVFRIVLRSDSLFHQMYRVDAIGLDSGKSLVAEFLVPWDSMACDTSGAFKAGMLCVGPLGETLGIALLTGNRGGSLPGTIFTPLVRFQIVFVAILLVLYLILMSRIRKKGPQRKSPRRSA